MSNQEFNAAGKCVVVAGLGISGRSMAKILRDAGATVIGVDEKLEAADLHSFDDIDWDEVDLVRRRCSTRARRSLWRRKAAALR